MTHKTQGHQSKLQSVYFGGERGGGWIFVIAQASTSGLVVIGFVACVSSYP